MTDPATSGLQPERTGLAWARTAAACATIAAVTVGLGIDDATGAGVIAAASGLLLSGVVMIRGRARARSLYEEGGAAPLPRRLVAELTVAAVATGLATLAHLMLSA